MRRVISCIKGIVIFQTVIWKSLSSEKVYWTEPSWMKRIPSPMPLCLFLHEWWIHDKSYRRKNRDKRIDTLLIHHAGTLQNVLRLFQKPNYQPVFARQITWPLFSGRFSLPHTLAALPSVQYLCKAGCHHHSRLSIAHIPWLSVGWKHQYYKVEQNWPETRVHEPGFADTDNLGKRQFCYGLLARQ